MRKISILTMLVAMVACSSSSRTKLSENVIGTIKNGVVSVNFDNINEKVDMPLSFWVESLEVVQLDGSTPEAFFLVGSLDISDNYILMKDLSAPVKIYDRHSGKFIGNIGNSGRGKGEYHATADAIINEKEKIIYLLPVRNDKIFVYSFDGKFIEEIPLPYTIRWGCFSIDEHKKIITIGQVPIDGKYYSKSVWQQDFKGNLIQGIDNDKFAMVVEGTPEYYGNTDAFDFQVTLWGNVPDTLFHYNAVTNNMDPVFVVDVDNFKAGENVQEKDVISINYIEINDYFFGSVGKMIRTETNSRLILDPEWVYINKKDLTGSKFTLNNDFLGGINLEYFEFFRGYYIRTYEPLELIEELELTKTTAKGKTLEYINELLKTIDPEGNNVMVFGKLKK